MARTAPRSPPCRASAPGRRAPPRRKDQADMTIFETTPDTAPAAEARQGGDRGAVLAIDDEDLLIPGDRRWVVRFGLRDQAESQQGIDGYRTLGQSLELRLRISWLLEAEALHRGGVCLLGCLGELAVGQGELRVGLAPSGRNEQERLIERGNSELGRTVLELGDPKEIQGVRVRAVDLECGLELLDGFLRLPLLRRDRAEVVVGLLGLRVGAGVLTRGSYVSDLVVSHSGCFEVTLGDHDAAASQKRCPIALVCLQNLVVLLKSVVRALVGEIRRSELQSGLNVVWFLLHGGLGTRDLPTDQRRTRIDVLVLVVDDSERRDADHEHQNAQAEQTAQRSVRDGGTPSTQLHGDASSSRYARHGFECKRGRGVEAGASSAILSSACVGSHPSHGRFRVQALWKPWTLRPGSDVGFLAGRSCEGPDATGLGRPTDHAAVTDGLDDLLEPGGAWGHDRAASDDGAHVDQNRVGGERGQVELLEWIARLEDDDRVLRFVRHGLPPPCST